MKSFAILIFACLVSLECTQHKPSEKQPQKEYTNVGGGCEGCEAIFDRPENIGWIDTLPDWHIPGIKLEVSGIIFQHDGKTPASNVILYVYHTDTSGHYTAKPGASGYWARHGYIRGWMKTNDKGEYKFYTNRPVAYPGTDLPAHIHPVIKEPDKNAYYISEYLFDDDPLLTDEKRKNEETRGGSGIVHPVKDGNGLWRSHRDIILGQNIPVYPI